jgi:hypothetical protein
MEPALVPGQQEIASFRWLSLLSSWSVRGSLTLVTRSGVAMLQELMDRARRGAPEDVDFILGLLTPNATIAVTKFADYALSLVESGPGVERLEFALFNGTQMQRNYCTLFFSRRGNWPLVKKAYDAGLIDEIQAFAR